MKGDGEGESFGLERSTSWKETDVFGLVDVGKHLKLDKKLIRFDVLMEILSTISTPPTPNRHFA